MTDVQLFALFILPTIIAALALVVALVGKNGR